MQNRVCELLNIRYPVIEGGLAYVGNGALAAAVSNGGGFGQVGVAGRSVDNFKEEVHIAAESTDKPFGVNLPLSEHSDITRYVEAILEVKDSIKAVSISAGNPKPLVPLFKQAGLKVMIMTASIKHSLKAQELGADLIVCEGFEAGGHNSPLEMTLFTILPQVTRAVTVPVVAAGAISNGQGVAAAFALGAEGVQLGTRFVATKECQAHDNYKQMLLAAKDDATVVLERSMGRVLRVLKNPFAEKIVEFEKSNPTVEELLPYIRGTNNRVAAIEGRVEEGWMNCGQGVGMINSIESATDVVKNLMQEAQDVIASLQRINPLFQP
ncbi:NAD(P)H-dependent flavin oxidoreductase [Effusibacillus dendaii]|uniref:Probable nitronate monooxygenase n=1 Tax=Effusibacillus dendaii TaxID=2743772 RepID=A0A7I8D9L7_9BACL|nr:nitronate monooxygenase family protein [Effusibacillus dendaii]BCJ86853.1 enoyl-ACP reductase II [Effusibacillus dendaii]